MRKIATERYIKVISEFAAIILQLKGERDALLALIEERVGIVEPVSDCDCMDCTALRKAREIVKSSEEKLKSEGDGG